VVTESRLAPVVERPATAEELALRLQQPGHRVLRQPVDLQAGYPPPQLARGRAQPPLRNAHRQAAARDQDAGERDFLGICEVAGERRERAPADGEPEVAVQPAADQLEVVGRQEQGARDHERREPHRHRDDAAHADRERAEQARAGED